MRNYYPRLRIVRNLGGTPATCSREGVSICFYTRRYHYEVMTSVWRALELYRDAVGQWTLDSYLDMDGYWQELNEESLELIRQQIFDPRAALLELRGVCSDDYTYGFVYQGRSSLVEYPGDVCTLFFYLPTEYLEGHGPDKVRELAIQMAREIPFDSGHAGLCLYYLPGTGIGISEEVERLSFHHPGLDLFPGSIHFQPLGSRLDGVHWLNFLGQPVLGELGGVESLRARLHSPGTTVYSLEGERALVTLGPWPESGDLEQGRPLPHYRELARALEPWLFFGRPPYSCFSGQEEMLRWERRFLDRGVPPP